MLYLANMAIHSYALTDVNSVKTYLGISGSTDDSLIEMLINQMTDWTENYCGGRRFKDTTYTNEIYESRFAKESSDFPQLARSKEYWVSLVNYPITATTPVAVSMRSGNTDYTVLDSTNYDVYEKRGQIYLYGGIPWIRKALKITYSAGYATIPTDLSMACIQLVCKLYEKRKSQGKKAESIGGASITWADPMNEMDGYTKGTLENYKRKYV
jgi:hypothetical protein